MPQPAAEHATGQPLLSHRCRHRSGPAVTLILLLLCPHLDIARDASKVRPHWRDTSRSCCAGSSVDSRYGAAVKRSQHPKA
eukprot:1159378-Pelagomonas_calceolata.AAC.4